MNPSVPDTVETCAVEMTADPSRRIGSTALRLWFVLYLVWMGLLTVGALWGYAVWRQGNPLGLPVWAICLGTFYLSLANNFCPLPTMWMVMLLASSAVGLPGPVPLRIAYVAAATAVATGMANLNEYHLLWAVGGRVAERVRSAQLVRWAIGCFRVSPFGILALASLVPIPIDAVRWIAIADGYNRWRFFWANVAGRWLRYALLAGATIWLSLGVWTILAVQAAVVAVAGVSLLVRTMRRRGRREAAAVVCETAETKTTELSADYTD